MQLRLLWQRHYSESLLYQRGLLIKFAPFRLHLALEESLMRLAPPSLRAIALPLLGGKRSINLIEWAQGDRDYFNQRLGLTTPVGYHQ